MSEEKRTSLRVKEVENEPFRYWVESASGGAPYLVDLTANVVDGKAYGQCSCINYQTRCFPNLKRHGRYIPYRRGSDGKMLNAPSDCQHIAAARTYMLMSVTMPMLAQFTNGIPNLSGVLDSAQTTNKQTNNE